MATHQPVFADPPDAHDAARDRIVVAARALIARHDPSQLDRRRVISEAGVSDAEFDGHFGDMSQLWRCVSSSMVSDMADIQRSLYGLSCSVADRLARALDFALDFVERDPDAYRSIRRMLDEPGPAGEQARSRVLRILTETAYQLSTLRGWPENPELVAQSLFAQLLCLIDYWQARPEHVTRDRVERFIRDTLGLAVGRQRLATR